MKRPRKDTKGSPDVRELHYPIGATVSVEALRWAFIQPVPTTQRFVLVVLADHADQAHSCYPSVNRIVERTGMARSTVLRDLQRLQEGGYIRIEERARENGSQTSNRYYLGAPNPDLDPLTGGSTSWTPPVHEIDPPRPGDRPPIESPSNPQRIDPHAEAFGAWWKIYPRKVSKVAAVKAWKARSKDKTLPALDDLIEATKRYAASVAGKDPEFIPHPATWLNQHRWEDVPASAPSGQDEGPSQAYLDWLQTPAGQAHLARKEADQ